MDGTVSKEVFKSSWTYEQAPESQDHVNLKDRYDLFIDGDFVPARDSRYFKTINPADNKVIAEVAEASEPDVDRAVKAARKAFKGWSSLPGKERGIRDGSGNGRTGPKRCFTAPPRASTRGWPCWAACTASVRILPGSRRPSV